MHDLISLFEDYSLETTAKDAATVNTLPLGLPRPAQVFVPWLPDEADEARIAACRAIRAQGLEPVPHLSARRIASADQLDRLLGALRAEAQVTSLFLIAGDLAQPSGPFEHSLAVIETGLLERHGFTHVGIAGHPDDHPDVAEPILWEAMLAKIVALRARGLETQIVTQFSFDATRVLGWLQEVRRRGVDVPVRIGIPGPAGVRTLLGFARRCGVSASASALAKYRLSLGRLIGNAGPDQFLSELIEGLNTMEAGTVRLHVFPFGGFYKFGDWMARATSAAAITA
ncbi:methylenetetrahydrofolate reductase [Novosphingobium terrae]|uniref:methylenetetrahydrofolate reductase n=1 Tax=Novosphingobium terrae TaxID=2726189 RepID=UPI00197D662A|nr:methylenetetrahydrofolate reductase [Novosphingobium terrae]